MGRNAISMTQIPSDEILESLYKLRIRGLRNSRPYWNCTEWRFITRKLGPDYHRLKTMVKRSIEQICE